MLFGILKNSVGGNFAPFAAIALFVVVVGASLWLTPRLAKWIDERRKDTPGFYDGMMDRPEEDREEE